MNSKLEVEVYDIEQRSNVDCSVVCMICSKSCRLTYKICEEMFVAKFLFLLDVMTASG